MLTAILEQALNVISTLTVHGLITDSNGTNVPLKLACIAVPLDLDPPWDIYPRIQHNLVFVPRPPSTCPEPGTVHVHLALGGKRGSGRTSIVHDAEILPTKPLPEHLPPLVLKVGRFNCRMEIAREAWFYDELECLQGVVVPRCYGWFEAELMEGQTYGSWYTAGHESGEESEDLENLDPESWTKDSERLIEMTCSRNFVSVLLLERLGGNLPLGVPLSDKLM